jgi:hypothetical protein
MARQVRIGQLFCARHALPSCLAYVTENTKKFARLTMKDQAKNLMPEIMLNSFATPEEECRRTLGQIGCGDAQPA